MKKALYISLIVALIFITASCASKGDKEQLGLRKVNEMPRVDLLFGWILQEEISNRSPSDYIRLLMMFARDQR
jgi:hypothetical protein